MLEHDLAVGVQLQSPIDPVEQLRAGLVLESGQGPRQRRLADREFVGRIGDMFGLGENDEPLEFLEVHCSTITKRHEVGGRHADDASSARRWMLDFAASLGQKSNE